MFILNFFRFLRGYVRFEADGPFVERFLNLCARSRLPVWDARRTGGKFTGYTDASCYRKLRTQAKKAGIRIRLSDKKGLPFTKKRYSRRRGLLMGVAVFFGFVLIMSNFIWRIEVNGIEGIPESRIREALEDMGIRSGTLRWRIDVRDSERRLVLKVPEISWAALNIDGSALRVEIDERTMPPEVIDPGDPCNIVAGESGQIVSINVFEGQATVSAGSAVLKGDILISGVTQDKQGQSLFRHARGEVFARCEFNYTVEIPLRQTKYIETGEVRTRGYVDILGLELPLFLPFKIPSPYHVEHGEKPVTILSAELPVSTLTERYHLMREEAVTLSEPEAQEQAMLELAALETVYLEGGEILERTMSATLEGDNFILKAHYICVIDIAEAREILHSDDSAGL